MPPNAAADVAVAAFTLEDEPLLVGEEPDPELEDEHPARDTAAATAVKVKKRPVLPLQRIPIVSLSRHLAESIRCAHLAGP
jgi:hypothetical protein